MAGNQAFSTSHRTKNNHKGASLVKTWFNQAAQKQRRRQARAAKAQKVFPRPLDLLRPSVTCCSLKYNLTMRAGRGFTAAELSAAGVSPQKARQLGISLDKRRVNKSQESIDRNAQRIKEYLSKVVVFAKDAPKEEISKATQFPGRIMPVVRHDTSIPTAAIASQTPLANTYETLRKERTAWRRVRKEMLRAKQEAKDAKTSKGKKE